MNASSGINTGLARQEVQIMFGGESVTMRKRTMKELVEGIFKLPPVEKRRMLEGPIKKAFYPHFVKEADDTYIYYLIMKRSFFVALFFSLLYWVSYAFGVTFAFYFFTVSVDPENFVRSMYWSYTLLVPTVLLLIFLPYGLLLFRANVNLHNWDLLWWNKIMQLETDGNRNQILKKYRAALILLSIGLYGGFAPPHLILKYVLWNHLEHSHGFFLLLLAAYPFLYSALNTGIVLCAVAFFQHWKRLGPYYNTAHNSNTHH